MEEESLFIWVIKNDQNHFVDAESINRSSFTYISFRTFTRECRGYTTEEQAKIALSELNGKRDALGLQASFHLERADLEKLIVESQSYKGKNIVIHEMKISI